MGRCPNPTRDALSRLRKGHCPLTCLGQPGLSALTQQFISEGFYP